MLASSRPSRVFLMGMMGSGKTAVGTVLARRLGWRYWDNDRRLHAAAGAPVDAVAATRGPEELHELEAEQAGLAAAEPPPLVAGIASSVVERDDLWPVLRAAGWCVYLRARPETLIERVGSGAGRPWLDADPAGFIRETLRGRGPFYLSLADLVIDVDVLEPDEIADRIVGQLRLTQGSRR